MISSGCVRGARDACTRKGGRVGNGDEHGRVGNGGLVGRRLWVTATKWGGASAMQSGGWVTVDLWGGALARLQTDMAL